MTTVAFDLTALRAGDTGVARYARCLHDALVAAHPDLRLRTYTIGRGGDPGIAVGRHVAVPLRAVHRAWQLLGAPAVERIVGPVDVSHTLDMIPAPTRAPLVLTVHDLLPLRRPERYGRRYRRIAAAHAHAARTRADVVITTCAATAADVAELGVPEERIVVAGVGHRPVPAVPPPPVVAPPYLLYVGAVTPRKGLPILVQAVTALGPACPPLVVAGPDGWAAGEVHTAVARAPAARVQLLGRVDDATLDALYAHATVVCHPSEAEGFGLPVLEAMAFGVPVAAGRTPPAAELLGDDAAGVLLPPGDPAAWGGALEALLADGSWRERLGAEGRRRASAWTWERCAGVVAGVYRSLAGQPIQA